MNPNAASIRNDNKEKVKLRTDEYTKSRTEWKMSKRHEERIYISKNKSFYTDKKFEQTRFSNIRPTKNLKSPELSIFFFFQSYNKYYTSRPFMDKYSL